MDYAESYQRQLKLVDQTRAGQEERIVFCTHPPVVTLGRGSQPTDLTDWTGEVVEINRGGKATYHGPSQLVIYPILDLTQSREAFPSKDIGGFLRSFESWVIQALSSFGLRAQSQPEEVSAEWQKTKPIFTGVWVGNKKVASIGVAVKKWVTHHGCAINLKYDPKAFSGISPCGFSAQVMSSLEQELGEEISYEQMKSALISASQW